MKILVTGGSGFIGSHIADIYIREGHEVIILDNLSTGNIRNLPKKARFIEGDINDKEIVRSIIKDEGIRVINHHAAQIDVRVSVASPQFDAMQNIIGSLNLISIATEYDLERFIFASTGGAIYGEPVPMPTDESIPTNPLSPYGVSKRSVELYLYALSKIHDFKYIALRYGNVYGPRQNAHGEAGVIAIFAERMLRDMDTTIFGDGLNTRDYVYAIDVAKANLLSLYHPENGIFNIGTSIETDVNTIFGKIKGLTDYKKPEHHGTARQGEQRQSVLDFTLAKKTLNWIPDINLDDGLKETVEYFKSLL